MSVSANIFSRQTAPLGIALPHIPSRGSLGGKIISNEREPGKLVLSDDYLELYFAEGDSQNLGTGKSVMKKMRSAIRPLSEKMECECIYFQIKLSRDGDCIIWCFNPFKENLKFKYNHPRKLAPFSSSDNQKPVRLGLLWLPTASHCAGGVAYILLTRVAPDE